MREPIFSVGQVIYEHDKRCDPYSGWHQKRVVEVTATHYVVTNVMTGRKTRVSIKNQRRYGLLPSRLTATPDTQGENDGD